MQGRVGQGDSPGLAGRLRGLFVIWRQIEMNACAWFAINGTFHAASVLKRLRRETGG